MELEDMKQLWQKMDNAINKQQNISENILKRMLHERNVSKLRMIANAEYIGLLFGILLFAILLTQVSRINDGVGLSICYIACLFFTVVTSVFSWYKVKYLSTLDKGTEAVSNMAEKTERFRLLIAKERIATLSLGPVILGVFYVVVNYLVKGDNILDDISMYLPRFLAAVAAYFVALPILYKKLYFSQIKQINNNLHEIAQFKA